MASHYRLLLAAFGVLLVSGVPGFAQTNTSFSRENTHSTVLGARVYAAAPSSDYDDVPVAQNITVAPMYQPIIRSMLERSATFRRQWARIARATDLTIELRCEPTTKLGAAAATTTIQRHLGQPTRAVVVISPVGRTAELIAHELEHVIEQLDGIDLQRKADVRGSGVRHCECRGAEAFETTRAIETGLRVAEDVGERRR